MLKTYYSRSNDWQASNANNKSEPSSGHSSPRGPELPDHVFTVVLDEWRPIGDEAQTLGIHVVPTYDAASQRDLTGLLVQRIEANARVHADGRIREGDRLVEVNGASLIGVDFARAQEILRVAIGHANQYADGRLEFRVSRSAVCSQRWVMTFE